MLPFHLHIIFKPLPDIVFSCRWECLQKKKKWLLLEVTMLYRFFYNLRLCGILEVSKNMIFKNLISSFKKIIAMNFCVLLYCCSDVKMFYDVVVLLSEYVVVLMCSRTVV